MKQLPSMTAALLVACVVLPADASPPETDQNSSTSTQDAGTRSNAERDAGAAADSERGDQQDAQTDLTGRIDPVQRLERAETAFRNAEFERILTLLRPTLEPSSKFDDTDRETRARELLGVGYFLTAQRATDAAERDQLLARSRRQFLELLRTRPDYELDPMVFPASVVDLFDQVRQANASELERIRKRRQSAGGGATTSSTPIYIERAYERRPFALNFFPLGVGQFQNDRPVRGGLYAAGQIAAIGTVVTGTFAIESMRDPETGRFERGQEYLRARSWRRTQWIAAGAFAAIYAASVIDAVVSYNQVGDVDIRTLDDPPPELDNPPGSSSSRGPPTPRFYLGPRGIGIHW